MLFSDTIVYISNLQIYTSKFLYLINMFMEVVEDKTNSKNEWNIDSVGNSRTILLEFQSKMARHISYKSWQL